MSKAARRARRNDRIATGVITTGGIAIIASVILILVLIVKVTLPLFMPTRIEAVGSVDLPAGVAPEDVHAVLIDDYLSVGGLLRGDGTLNFFSVESGESLGEHVLRDDASVRMADQHQGHRLSILWEDGQADVYELSFERQFEEDGTPFFAQEVEELVSFEAPDDVEAIQNTLARANDDDGLLVRVDLLEDNSFRITRQTVEEGIFGNQEVSSDTAVIPPLKESVSAMAVNEAATELFAGTHDGMLYRFDIEEEEPELLDAVLATEDDTAISALNMVFGDVSIAVGDASGQLSTWFPARLHETAQKRMLQRVHELVEHDSPVATITPSRRTKTLLSLSAQGVLSLDHMTSESQLVVIAPPEPVTEASLSLRENAVIALVGDEIQTWELFNPHPEASWKTLFGKVWYEDYTDPEYVWQSSAATDRFEPKLSLIPLIFGSLKATFYAMLFATPLALFGAIYTSQFTPSHIKGWLKSTVEVMAAIPSVVIGFLIALWLAPLVENWIMGFLISVAVFPMVFVLFIIAWQPFRHFNFAKQIESGYEFLVMLPIVVLAAVASWFLGGYVEQWFFGGNFQLWLFQEAGQRFDQRNSIIIAFGLGFAVIPIIFTITEDALSNVPQNLKAASLAMGATRWQTVWRVVLPSASPGIFAAIIIGLGRAAGETMIVLMATGNTPVLDMSIFNGMRTLSANIAVEIPEAPVNGTLYRVLFLSAVILLILTSILNTGAELVRQHLRKKYGLFD